MTDGRRWKVKAEDLHEAIHAEPFQPFDLMLADGTRLPIPHPDCISHPIQLSRRVVVWTPDDRVNILDVALLSGVDHKPPVPAGSIAPNPNGGE